MGQDEKYSFISVNAGDEDEIVIQTGAVQSGAAKPGVDGAQPSEHFEESPDASEQFDVFESADEQAVMPEVLDVDEVVTEAAPVRTAPDYNETTREDLETVEPMSKTQKAVIACVIVLVVGFAAYYIFLR